MIRANPPSQGNSATVLFKSPSGRDPSDVPRQDESSENRTVILVGASVRAATQAARASGFTVVAVDLFADVDTADAASRTIRLERLTHAHAAGVPIDTILPRAPVMIVGGIPESCLGGLGPGNLHDALLSHGSASCNDGRACPPPINASLASTLRLRDPTHLKTILEKSTGHHQQDASPESIRATSRLRLPESRLIRKGELRPLRVNRGKWLSKPVFGSGGVGIVRLNSHSATSRPARQAAYAQRFVAGHRYGVVYLVERRAREADEARNPRVLPHAERVGICRALSQRVGDQPFMYAGSLGPLSVAQVARMEMRTRSGRQQSGPPAESPCAAILDRLREFVIAVAANHGLRGLVNVDVIVDRHGQGWVLEVNPRWSASCEILAESKRPGELFAAHYRASRGLPVRPWAPTTAAGEPERLRFKRIVFASNDGWFFHDAMDELPVGVNVADRPADATPLRRGDPILTLVGTWRQGAAEMRRMIRVVKNAVRPASG